MEEMIYSFFLSHGWKLTLIALSGILILGLLKTFNVFKKLEEGKRKYVYGAISTGFSIAAAGIYLAAVGSFAWSTFGLLSLGIFGVNQAAYAMYENYGVRALFQKLGSIIVTLFTKKANKQSAPLIDDLADEENEKKSEKK